MTLCLQIFLHDCLKNLGPKTKKQPCMWGMTRLLGVLSKLSTGELYKSPGEIQGLFFVRFYPSFAKATDDRRIAPE